MANNLLKHRDAFLVLIGYSPRFKPDGYQYKGEQAALKAGLVTVQERITPLVTDL